MQNTNMKLLLLLHILQLLFSSATGSNTLYQGQSLSVNQTLTSTNGIFQLGFLKATESGTSFISYNNDGDYYYDYCICIWYKKLPSKTRVWCTFTVSGLSSALVITTNWNLQIRNDTKSFFIWSSSHFNSTKLVLEDTGNLILKSLSNTSQVFWQSFDYPTDTWLPGAKIKFKIGYSSERTTSPYYVGPYFGLDADTMGTILLQDGYDTRGSCMVKGSSLTCSLYLDWYNGETQVLLSKETNVTYVSNEHETYFTYTVTNPAILTRFVINYGKFFTQLVWSEEYQDWMPSKVRLSDTYCDQFAVYNDEKDFLHSSNCTRVTETVSSVRKKESITQGSRMMQCHEGDREGFVLIQRAILENDGIFPPVSPNGCKRACLEDCNYHMKPLLFLHVLQLLLLKTTGSNTLYPNQSLSAGQNLTSSNGIFQFGFTDSYSCKYRPDIPSYFYDYCIGTWYNKHPSQTLVWCNPWGQSSGLTITISGYLAVHGGVLVWSTPDSNSTKLVLDTGNLVVKSISNNSKVLVLWQSFDHPTDTWLPGAKLGFNKLTKASQVYESIYGDYSFELDSDETNVILLKEKDNRYGICRVKGSFFTCSLNLELYTVESEFLLYKGTNLSYVSTENEAYYMYTVTNSTTLTRVIISDNGSVIQLQWSEDYKDWMPSKLKLFHIHCNQFSEENHKEDTSQPCITNAPPTTDQTSKSDPINAPPPHGRRDSGTKPQSKVSLLILGVTSSSISIGQMTKMVYLMTTLGQYDI